MTTRPISDILATAKKAPRPHHDVDVHLDDDTGSRIADLETEIENLETEADTIRGDFRLGDPRPAKIESQIEQIRAQIAAVEAEAAESLIVLRFHRLPAEEWADIVARAPQRVDVPIDLLYGYNVHAAARAAAPASGVRLVTDDTNGETEEAVDEDQWEQLLDLLTGRDFRRIVDAVFDLNDYGPKRRLDAARKASRAGSGNTSNSP